MTSFWTWEMEFLKTASEMLSTTTVANTSGTCETVTHMDLELFIFATVPDMKASGSSGCSTVRAGIHVRRVCTAAVGYKGCRKEKENNIYRKMKRNIIKVPLPPA